MSAEPRQHNEGRMTEKRLPHLPHNERSGRTPTDDTPQVEGESFPELVNQLKPGVH